MYLLSYYKMKKYLLKQCNRAYYINFDILVSKYLSYLKTNYIDIYIQDLADITTASKFKN